MSDIEDQRVVVVSDVRTIFVLHRQFEEAGIKVVSDRDTHPTELGFSDLGEAIAVLVGSGGALAALCKTVVDVVKERKKKVTLKKNGETYQFENLTADDIGKILSASPASTDSANSTNGDPVIAIENNDTDETDEEVAVE